MLEKKVNLHLDFQVNNGEAEVSRQQFSQYTQVCVCVCVCVCFSNSEESLESEKWLYACLEPQNVYFFTITPNFHVNNRVLGFYHLLQPTQGLS